MPEASTVLIALGANLPLASASIDKTLRIAINMLHEQADITITACSRFWETPAIPAGSGPVFVNAALQARTRLDMGKVLEVLHRIEADFGRDRSTGRWSARVLDMDLLACDDLMLPDAATYHHWAKMPVEQQVTHTPDQLILPHPRMQDRGFVLAPLADIVPGWIHPVTGKSVVQMLASLSDEAKTGITPYENGKLPCLP